MSKIIVGITGTIASGKGLAGDYFKQKGFTAVECVSIIREEVARQGLEPTRKNLQDVGNALRKRYGGNVLVARILSKAKTYQTNIVITGIRNMGEIDYLRKEPNSFIIGVDAPFEVRWARVKNRNRDTDLLNQDKFVIDDARDRGFNEPLDGQQVGMCLVHADYLIHNDENVEQLEGSAFYKQLGDVYKDILKKSKK